MEAAPAASRQTDATARGCVDATARDGCPLVRGPHTDRAVGGADVRADRDTVPRAHQRTSLRTGHDTIRRIDRDTSLRADRDTVPRAHQRTGLRAGHDTNRRIDRDTSLRADRDTVPRAHRRTGLRAGHDTIR
ncbi:hypothetical protein AB0E00_00505, partial [Streptomyces sp. NPDC048110]|uniref:hypothetical protein n=1 Tax=Streptomyces sp. NPDC048110 TaxID=3155483 RepID=UPI00340C7A40